MPPDICAANDHVAVYMLHSSPSTFIGSGLPCALVSPTWLLVNLTLQGVVFSFSVLVLVLKSWS